MRPGTGISIVTKVAVGIVGGAGLLYLGGVFDLDDKISNAYGATKTYIADSVKSSVCGEVELSGNTERMSEELADYVAQQSPHEQRRIASAVYDALSPSMQENVVENGFKRLPYDSKVAVLETMVDTLKRESRTQQQYSQK